MVNERPCSANSTPRLHGETARLLLAFGCLRGLGGFLVFPLEALHASGRIEQLLFPGEEGMAARADLNFHEIRLEGGACLERAAAGAMYRNFVIIRMDPGFHSYSFRSRSARLFGTISRRLADGQPQ